MFYLTSFFRILLKNPISGYLFFILSFLLIGSALRVDLLEKQIPLGKNSKQGGDYFYCLIDAREGIASIGRKIQNLPGVSAVREISEQEIDERLQEVFSEIGTEFELESKYGGLQIVYNKGLEKRSQSLVREYLVRLVGRSKVTLGPIKRVDIGGKEKGIKANIVRQVVAYGIVVVIAIFWQVCSFFFGKRVFENAYIISQYQRKKMVGFKIFFSGTILLIVVSALGFIFVKPANIIPIISVGVLFIVNVIARYKREAWLG